MFVGLFYNFFSLHSPYAEQWKPINPEEKKQYDREFLLGFQFIGSSMHKPEGLPQISDVVLDKVRLLSGLGVVPIRYSGSVLLRYWHFLVDGCIGPMRPIQIRYSA